MDGRSNSLNTGRLSKMVESGSLNEHSDVLVWVISGGGSALFSVLAFFAVTTLNDLKKSNEDQWNEIRKLADSLNRLWGQHDARHDGRSGP